MTPAWFDPLAAAAAQFDKLGQLKAASSMLRVGYVLYESAGKEHQKFGDEFPGWRQETKTGPLAPTSRRLAQAPALGDDLRSSAEAIGHCQVTCRPSRQWRLAGGPATMDTV